MQTKTGDSMIVYSLKKNRKTNELHLFTGRMNPDAKTCTVTHLSICRKMAQTDGDDYIFACKDEGAARQQAATRGREVCGTCVSSLYATF